ncbi:MAG: alpha/beta fold hydrolase [Rhodospirillales bacterium]|nr:alpha/beta fold hydrolase [Rhodospirillales bacterium]
MSGSATDAISDQTEVVGEEHWAKKGDVDLFIYRKYAPSVGKDGERPVLMLVHGSSQASRTSVDLEVPGRGEYSTMNTFARWGYDVWTMDHEGYGRSSRTDGFSYILDGVEDLRAATPIVAEKTGQDSFAFFGTSSGALRAGAFCNAEPDRVTRIALSAFPWKGEGAPSLIKRNERIDEWQATNRREVNEEYYQNMFTRDIVGLTVPELGKVAAAAEMANGGGSVPNGTYIDMCVNLPSMDPTKIECPVMIFRGDHDGIATEEDLMGFYAALPTKEKQIVMVSGQAHNTALGINRHRFWHVLHGFLDTPDRLD